MKVIILHRWYSLFPKHPWISIYTWVVFCLLPFFFIFKSSSFIEIVIGIVLLLLFFICYRFSFKSKSGTVYMWLSFEIIINIVMTLLFGFVYFALFTAFLDRKSTRLNSSHVAISYAVFCLKKKKYELFDS